jgi:glycosyltransferase involved in cell wall biosynthesis
MRVLLLNYEFPPLGGGSGNATFYILREFAKCKNLEIDLVTSSTSQFRVLPFSDNVSVHFLDIGKKGSLLNQTKRDLILYSFKAFYYCKRLIRERSYDLVHAFFGIPSGFVAMELRLPYVISLRGSDVPGHNPAFDNLHRLLHPINKKVWKRAALIVANSNDLRRTALRTNFAADIKVISNGVDCNFFKPAPHKQVSESLRVLFVGRLNRVKNADLIIKAISGLDDVIFNIVGDGPEKEKLVNLANKLSATGKVNFLGRMDQERLVEVYQQNDVFVLPSTNEGGSNTVLEAMACGLALILTNTGGASELIKRNGFILNEISDRSIREKLDYLLGHKRDIVQMGLESRRIVEKMSWGDVARQYLETYNELT